MAEDEDEEAEEREGGRGDWECECGSGKEGTPSVGRHGQGWDTQARDRPGTGQGQDSTLYSVLRTP